jgi:hypothetical protein
MRQTTAGFVLALVVAWLGRPANRRALTATRSSAAYPVFRNVDVQHTP